MPIYQFFNHLAILSIGKVFAFTGHRHFYGFVFTFHHQHTVLLTYFYTVFYYNAFKNSFFITAVTAFYFEFFAWFKFRFTAYFKRFFGWLTIQNNQRGNRNAVHFLVHSY